MLRGRRNSGRKVLNQLSASEKRACVLLPPAAAAKLNARIRETSAALLLREKGNRLMHRNHLHSIVSRGRAPEYIYNSYFKARIPRIWEMYSRALLNWACAFAPEVTQALLVLHGEAERENCPPQRQATADGNMTTTRSSTITFWKVLTMFPERALLISVQSRCLSQDAHGGTNSAQHKRMHLRAAR